MLLDVHSYNHRRNGPEAPATDPEAMPEINIGTFSMDREKWAWIVDPFVDKLREFDFRGRRMDVRENIAFQAKGNRLDLFMRNFRIPVVQSQSSSRNSSWTNGLANLIEKHSWPCAA